MPLHSNSQNISLFLIDFTFYISFYCAFRFLNEKDSENYKMYRQKVMQHRAVKLGQPPPTSHGSNEKYDPEDILRDDDQDIDNAPQLMNIPSLSSNSEDYDSDSEYMQETMERNLKNMKHRIDSGSAKKRYAEPINFSSDEADHTDEEDLGYFFIYYSLFNLYIFIYFIIQFFFHYLTF